MAIWSIVSKSGIFYGFFIFYGNLVYFPRVGKLQQEKSGKPWSGVNIFVEEIKIRFSKT
jgi:hypothetical protein